jgi:undecaprenyl-diphosphatase
MDQKQRVALAARLCVGLFVAFLAIAGLVQGNVAFKGFDLELADRLVGHANATPALAALMEWVTELGAFWTLAAFTIACGLVLLVWRRYLLVVDWLLATAGGGLFNLGLKELFHRQRYERMLVEEHSWSFPSGHSMGSALVYGLAVYFLARVLPAWAPRWPLVVGVVILAGLIGFSRMYLGAHYFSDVIGGFTAAGFWIALWVLLIEVRDGPAKAANV